MCPSVLKMGACITADVTITAYSGINLLYKWFDHHVLLSLQIFKLEISN